MNGGPLNPEPMTISSAKSRKIILTLFILIAAAGLAFFYHPWRGSDPQALRAQMLNLLPADSSAVIFLDLDQFRTTPFLAQLLQWAPQAPTDEEYKKFVQASGFDYERDLDRMAISISKKAGGEFIFGIADGHFDRKKIEDYAGKNGKQLGNRSSNRVFAVPLNNSPRTLFFTFLNNRRIAWTDDSAVESESSTAPRMHVDSDWQEHFSRLAGTPLFAVFKQDSGALAGLSQQAPGGFRSPQLAELLAQLRWISLGGKPEGSILRVVAEGECPSDNAARQLNDFLGGIVLLAQAGLNGPKASKQLDPALRDAYLELLRSVEVKKIDRGDIKSVRAVFYITPKLLQAASTAKSAGATTSK
jgi:hypothetical protein